MGKSFTENTRVQVPAALHLCRLGYTYLDNIRPEDYDHASNILVSVFRESVKRLNPFVSESSIDALQFALKKDAVTALIGMNSSLFWWFCTVYSDCRHVNKREVEFFPLPFDSMGSDVRVSVVAQRLMKNLDKTSERRVMRFSHDALTIQCIIPKYSKPIIDEIDELLAKYYGFTEEELDFIINYDIKYRMGDQLNAGE